MYWTLRKMREHIDKFEKVNPELLDAPMFNELTGDKIKTVLIERGDKEITGFGEDAVLVTMN